MTTTAETPGPASEAAPLLVTGAAFRRARQLLDREGLPDGSLRVGVKGGGCAGYSYVFRLEPGGPRPGDVVLEGEGARVLVDAKSARILQGSTLTFTDGLTGRGFEFDNPNAVRTCGCGTSFSA
ncbi:MAG TPA: iron-sulfur cluster assembly accessory protein [Gemmatimonadota bacterium]